VRDEAVRPLAEQDLARPARLLEPLADHDGLAGHEAVSRGGIAGDDLAGIDADPHLERCAGEMALGRNTLAQLDRGPDRAERVVLAHQRYAEHGHHLVADELLDRAAVALNHTGTELEEVGHDAPQRLGVESLGESGGRDDVAEQHRHRLARLQGRVDGKWRPAGPAEVSIRRVPGPAGVA